MDSLLWDLSLLMVITVLFVAWLDTKSEIIDSTLIDMSGTMSICPDDI
ncbi:MAG: hypothetical protein IPG39_16290 [Bacteroidetes bacterium]|nr:hypothetical protein [Bacteroidota bacterium]